MTTERMVLHWSPRSPYVRKAVIAAHELGLQDRIELVRTVVGGTEPHHALMRENPPEKVAAMLERAGFVIVSFEPMHHANAIYQQYKGADKHALDCLYVVRGHAPAHAFAAGKENT